MKIALSAANMNVGGIGTFVLSLGQALVRAGHEVEVVASGRGAWWSRLEEAGVRGHFLPRPRWDVRQYFMRRTFVKYVVKQQIDLLVINIGSNNHLPMQALPMLSSQLPVVLVLHNDTPEVYDLAAVNQTLWRCAVGVSPQVKQQAAERFPQKNVHYIPYGIALPTMDRLQMRADASLPLKMIFVGRLIDRQKGIFRLPSILAECRRRRLPVRLTVIGDGSDRLRLQEMFTEMGVADLVDMLGVRSNAEATEQMRRHHVLFMPSNYEGLGLVIMEAQANGCVPIAAHLRGVTDSVIAHGVDGLLVEPTDIAAYADAVERLLDAEEWQRCSRSGIDRAQQQYSVEQMARRYEALFESLVRGGIAA